MSPDDHFQLIMIDLEGFRRLNKKYGHQKADETIAYIAQTIEKNMRRNEWIYKQPMPESPPMPFFLRRIYRKYAGGDGFIFLLGGDEAAALGFLRRLKVQFDGEFTRHISENLLFDKYSMRFHAGVCILDAEDTVKSALDRLSECLMLARQTGSPLRVFWSSKKTAEDFPGDPYKALVYSKATEEFKQ
jgi:GGDEF domain-containing protein